MASTAATPVTHLTAPTRSPVRHWFTSAMKIGMVVTVVAT